MDVVVVGGGVIGLAVAWRLSQRGLQVTVVDPDPTGGASHAAAGMLAPVTELHYGEETLLALNLESNRRWPEFAAELESASGLTCGYRREGTVAVALDAGDRAVLSELVAYQQSLGLSVELLTGRQVRALEPMLAPAVCAGTLVAHDRSVDNRRLRAALLATCLRSGVQLVREPALAVEVTAGQADGVRLGSGDVVTGDCVVVAAGVESASLGGIPAGAVPVRPVKGQILRLRVPDHLRPLPIHTVRATVVGKPVYLVPRADGELVIGATSEELGFDTSVTAGAVHRLLRDARAVVPAVDELELVETLARLRPCTPDNAPLIGETAVPGLVAATGHYRNGMLLTPVTADLIADLVTGGVTPSIAEPFSPRRFKTAQHQEVPA